ncbi:hypothetical protein ACFSL4_37435 [Streptomyces caeni]|uniref:GIY-YIG nuclease family protein n=1 Tax=Streptomyces caeni TaxID=2307231 RepID=A0ABW4J240_9ACTN
MTDTDRLSRIALRYREEDSPALLIEAGITRMLDTPTHQVLQQDLEDMATPWQIFPATDQLASNLPDSPGLYMFVWRPGFRLRLHGDHSGPLADTSGSFPLILYIGQAGGASRGTNTLRNRYKNYRKHLRGDPEELWTQSEPRRRAERLTRYLSLGPLEFWCAVVEDRSRIEGLEKRLIRLFNPPLNDQNRPRLRVTQLGDSHPAWPS